MSERILKWKQLKKQGIATFDSSQEGAATETRGSYNQWFNGYDDTVKEGAIQAIQLAMDSIEQTVSSITGVFRERLNMIEQRDAVTNIKQGVANSFIITKQWYHQMDLVMTEILIDCMNLAKRVWKKGLTGTLILGDKYQRVFTALPEHFTVTDHDIRILTSSEINRDLEQIKAIIPEFVKSGGLPPDIIMEAMTSKSIPDLKQKIRRAMQIQKQENNQIQQLTQQVDQLQKQLKEASSQLDKSTKQVEKLNNDKLELEKQEQKMKYQLEWYKAKTDREYRESTSEERKRRTDIEQAQLYDGNSYNDKVKQIGLESA